MYQNGTYIGINKTKNFLFGTLHNHDNSMLKQKNKYYWNKGIWNSYRSNGDSRWHDGVRALGGWCLQGVHIGKHITGIEKKYSEHHSVLL